MDQLFYVRKLVVSALCVALCVVLPIAFHMIPGGGSLFSPMHIPVLLCGLVCGWPYGILCGAVGPLLSSLLTSMPLMAYLPGMMVELVAYGFVAGVLMKIVHTGQLHKDVYISLIVAMLAGRVVAGFAQALIFRVGDYGISLWLGSYFVGTWPGLIVQLILIPVIIFALEKAGLVMRGNK